MYMVDMDMVDIDMVDISMSQTFLAQFGLVFIKKKTFVFIKWWQALYLLDQEPIFSKLWFS